MTRILGFVTSCKDCPKRRDRTCSLLGDAHITNIETIAGFCPLPRYPTEEIENLETTVEGQRHLINKTGPWTVGQFLVLRLASMLNISMTPNWSVELTTTKDEKIYIIHDYFMSSDATSGYHTFNSPDGNVYQVALGSLVGIRKRVDASKELQEKDGTTHLWESVYLK